MSSCSALASRRNYPSYDEVMKNTSQEYAMCMFDKPANANPGIEGFQPNASDKAIQAWYIEGTATLVDLLDHTRSFVRLLHNSVLSGFKPPLTAAMPTALPINAIYAQSPCGRPGQYSY